jgi:hypothetical protein
LQGLQPIAGHFEKDIYLMKSVLLATAAFLALAIAPAAAQQKTVKIGFISSFGGPAAAVGNDMRNSFELALDHHGRKLGGLPVEVIGEGRLPVGPRRVQIRQEPRAHPGLLRARGGQGRRRIHPQDRRGDCRK